MIESLVPEGKSPEQDGQRESPGEPAEESARARNRDEGRFPEMKELKQRLRDRIAPDKSLGHSDARPEQ